MTDLEFNKIIPQYEKLIFTICYQFVKDYALAEDLAQDTFLSAYIHKDSCPENALKPWLARIATNKAKDYLKSAYNRHVLRTECPDDEILPLQPDNSLHSKPDDAVIASDGEENIKNTIYTLKEPYLKVSVMFFLQEKSIDEISALLERPPKTVHTQLYRAKHMLQQLLKGEIINE